MEELSFLSGLDGLLSVKVPARSWEKRLAAEGVAPVAALDEAGRGPLAGPVVVGVVIFDGPCAVKGVNDSKQIAPEKREELEPQIKRRAIAWAVASASAEEIDRINILQATRLAAERALAMLPIAPRVVLTDALTLPRVNLPVVPIIKGDAKVRAIGAASILAKVHRDRLMRRLARQFPQYGFQSHFGYCTPEHQARLAEFGPCTLHRLTFEGARPRGSQPLIVSRFGARVEKSLLPTRRERVQRWIERAAHHLPQREIEALLARCAAA